MTPSEASLHQKRENYVVISILVQLSRDRACVVFANFHPRPICTAAPGTAAAAPPAAEPAVSAESVETLVSICAVSERQAKGALVACGGSVERACDWIFSRMDGSLDEEVEKALNPPAAGGGCCSGAA